MKTRILVFAGLWILAGCGPKKVENPITFLPADSRQAAVEISVDWLNNPQFTSLEQLKGRVVLLNFWATWCGPCRMEIPGLVKIREKYKGNGFEVLGLSVDQADPKDPESPEKTRQFVREFMEANKIQYPLGLSGLNNAQAYQIGGIPASFLIDKQGRVAQRIIGLYPEDVIEDAVRRLMEEPAGPGVAIPKP